MKFWLNQFIQDDDALNLSKVVDVGSAVLCSNSMCTCWCKRFGYCSAQTYVHIICLCFLIEFCMRLHGCVFFSACEEQSKVNNYVCLQ